MNRLLDWACDALLRWYGDLCCWLDCHDQPTLHRSNGITSWSRPLGPCRHCGRGGGGTWA